MIEEHKDVVQNVEEEEILALVEEMVKIPSHQNVEDEEKELAHFLRDRLEAAGIETELQEVADNRANVFGRVGQGGPGKTLMLNGHMDTVPPGNMSGPFTPRRKNGRLYGRGAVDMKGALGAMVYAAEIIQESGIDLDGQVLIAGVVGEESGSPGTHYITEHGPRADLAVVGEPTELKVGVAHKGIEWLRIEVEGKSAHASVPHEGINAVYRATEVVQALRKKLIPLLEEKHDELLGAPTFNVGVIRGGSYPNIVPDQCRLEIDRRWIPGESLSSIYREVEQILDDLSDDLPEFKFSMEQMEEVGNFTHTPLDTDPDHPLVKTCQAILEDLGRDITVSGVTYWSDAALLSDGADIPSVVLGPGSIDQAHGPQEYVNIEQLSEAVKVYLLLALEICNS
ncbi:MAG: M20 family metallopeptidase [Candidatus Acetothermia bacterium]